ncbi:MAG: TraB/GumN family protein [Rickettsia endosymbiont of Sceptobius lativentris]|nr:TraB/GumN family protein [Rickettsia endosymbiont of Sceptobius lativentris]
MLNKNADSTHDDIDPRILKIAAKALSHKSELNLKLHDLSHEGVIMLAALDEGHKGMDSELARHYLQEGKLVLNLDEANTTQGIDMKYIENYMISCVEDPRGMNLLSLEYLKGHILTDMIPSNDGPMLIKQRNTAWITKIDHSFKEYNKDIVCCVGTAHLFGEYGLLKLLIERGYLINRINNDLSKIRFSRDDLNELESSAKDLFIYDENINEWFINKELDIELAWILHEGGIYKNKMAISLISGHGYVNFHLNYV